MKRKWLYHRECGGKIFNLDEIDEEELALKGWEDIPFDNPARKEGDEDEVTIDSLKEYALEKYGVKLDGRRSLETLTAEVEALDNGDSA